MNVAARDLRSRRPAHYNARAFERLLRLLPDAALSRLETIVERAQSAGADMDVVAVSEALLRQALIDADNALPPVPADLLAYADPEVSAGREYGLLLAVDLHDHEASVAAREQFIREARQVCGLVEGGMDAVTAWRQVARQADLDAAMPSLPLHRSHLPAPSPRVLACA